MAALRILAALPLIAALTFAQHAQASAINWHLGEGGVSAGGTLTIAPDPNSGSDFWRPN